MKPILMEFRHVVKRYGDRVLLHVEEFDIIQGFCTLISGDNGAGKTTLLKIFAGLLKPEQTNVVVNGIQLPWSKARYRYLKNIGFVHQDPYMLDTTVQRNLSYGLRMARVPRSQIEDKVAEALRWARLDHLMHRKAKQLSVGEKQRVALTRARLLAPRALILDEPTANMDLQSRIATYQLIQQLRDEGMAVVVASHDRSGFEPLADRHLQLTGGKLVTVDIVARHQPGADNVAHFPRN
ncbi:MAG: energy-coupling factor ABC transporter ATP-binding protein [Gammaproteobacteria bacterium]|nr:energy-coupling factor ABC transporter ATP-binding protein [Gammaproteobacteria bacterium]